MYTLLGSYRITIPQIVCDSELRVNLKMEPLSVTARSTDKLNLASEHIVTSQQAPRLKCIAENYICYFLFVLMLYIPVKPYVVVLKRTVSMRQFF